VLALSPLLILWLAGIEALRMATVYGWPGKWSNPQSALNGEEELFGVGIAAIPMTVIFLAATAASLVIAVRTPRRGPALITSAVSALGVLALLCVMSVLFLALHQ
jgi:hypothetical protein